MFAWMSEKITAVAELTDAFVLFVVAGETGICYVAFLEMTVSSTGAQRWALIESCHLVVYNKINQIFKNGKPN